MNTVVKMTVGDLIVIDGSLAFDHGCRDLLVAEYIGKGEAVVISASNCTSCWQVGHDNDHIFATVGEVLKVNGLKLTYNDPAVYTGYTADVKYYGGMSAIR